MLQVARLAPNLLADATPKVSEFLHGEFTEDGGARDRSGKADLYYTAFALEGLLALREELPVDRVRAYLLSFADGEGLDLVHLACLVRCWASLGAIDERGPAFRQGVLERLATHRSADGGYAIEPGRADGTMYHAFLALGLVQDLGAELPDVPALAASLDRLRTADGAYANASDLAWGTTPSTAAAAALMRHLDLVVPAEVGPWMLARVHEQGGFLALPDAPLPDLLSTATALHALASLEVSFEPVRERCLDFLDTLWTGRAFTGHWAEDDTDCEYLFYALLALGHLSL